MKGIALNKICRRIFISVFVLLCFLLIWWKWGMYDLNYWKNIGRNYNEVLQKFGAPQKVEPNTTCFKAYFKDIKVVCSNNGSIYLAEIENRNIRFGIFNIGIGSSKKNIEKIYFYKKKIIDLKENEFGVVDGVNTITFVYDENNCVKKMYVCKWYY